MDNEEAKFFLAAGQPSGEDANRPEMAEAMEHAQRDPALREWLVRERKSDAAIATKMRALEPPAELRARLIAGGRASRRASLWKAWRLPLAMAACATLAAGIAWFIQKPDTHAVAEARPPLIEWQEASLAFFSIPNYRLDVMSPEYPVLEAHLLESGTRVVDGALPFNNGISRPVGCKVLEWNGHLTSLTCFFSREGQLVHLFVLPRGPVDESLIHGRIHKSQVGEYATVTWLQGDRIVMVASLLPAAKLDGVLARDTRVAVLVASRSIH